MIFVILVISIVYKFVILLLVVGCWGVGEFVFSFIFLIIVFIYWNVLGLWVNILFCYIFKSLEVVVCILYCLLIGCFRLIFYVCLMYVLVVLFIFWCMFISGIL